MPMVSVVLTLAVLLGALLNGDAIDTRPATAEDVERTISALPKSHYSIPYFLRDGDWKVHSGDLRIEKDFVNHDQLVVEGNLIVGGTYDDFRSAGPGCLVVLGDMRAGNVISWGSIAVKGTLSSDGLVYAYYNDYSFEATRVKARALVIFDKGYNDNLDASEVEVALYDRTEQKEEVMAKAIGIFEPEVLAPHLFDQVGVGLTEVIPDYDVCQDRLAQGRSVFRAKEAAPSLLTDLKEATGSKFPRGVKVLVEKDRLLAIVIAMRDDLPPALKAWLRTRKDRAINAALDSRLR